MPGRIGCNLRVADGTVVQPAGWGDIYLNCQFCGNDLGLTALTLRDRDFCTPAHRRKFHDRLRKAFQLIVDPAPESMPSADFIRYAVHEPGFPGFPSPSALPLRILNTSLPVGMGAASLRFLQPLPPEMPEPIEDSPSTETGRPPQMIPITAAQPPQEIRDTRSEMKRRLGSIRADLQSKRTVLAARAAG